SVLRQVDDDLFAVAFLGTDQLVTCGRRGRLARLDLRTGEEVFSAESHLGRAGCVAISPDGTRALTGGRDQTIRLWETSTLCQLAAFSAAGPVHSVCFSTTGALAFYGTDTAVGA